ncbi:hypothetical protein NLJ89_g7122 [Agrocybe chaxingu]|uniref:Uncharacterized protein n=1 Tax=Agrocybe chaxingu TaxID=84603 RepID=A0A9W8JZN9_9AGAR|nr:hypothetical protein NLJ89_g7122 [Agrocybe chaxingu]
MEPSNGVPEPNETGGTTSQVHPEGDLRVEFKRAMFVGTLNSRIEDAPIWMISPDNEKAMHIYSENTKGHVSNRTFIVSGTGGSLLGFKDTMERLSMAALRGQSGHASESRETDERNGSGEKSQDVPQG